MYDVLWLPSSCRELLASLLGLPDMRAGPLKLIFLASTACCLSSNLLKNTHTCARIPQSPALSTMTVFNMFCPSNPCQRVFVYLLRLQGPGILSINQCMSLPLLDEPSECKADLCEVSSPKIRGPSLRFPTGRKTSDLRKSPSGCLLRYKPLSRGL